MAAIVFTPEKRQRFLALFEVGRGVAEAAQLAGVTRQTVSATAKRGRADEAVGKDTTDAAFARRYDSIKSGNGPIGLERSDLVRLLEEKARSGNVIAMKLLLERPWEKKVAKVEKPTAKPGAFFDELAARRAQ